MSNQRQLVLHLTGMLQARCCLCVYSDSPAHLCRSSLHSDADSLCLNTLTSFSLISITRYFNTHYDASTHFAQAGFGSDKRLLSAAGRKQPTHPSSMTKSARTHLPSASTANRDSSPGEPPQPPTSKSHSTHEPNGAVTTDGWEQASFAARYELDFTPLDAAVSQLAANCLTPSS